MTRMIQLFAITMAMTLASPAIAGSRTHKKADKAKVRTQSSKAKQPAAKARATKSAKKTATTRKATTVRTKNKTANKTKTATKRKVTKVRTSKTTKTTKTTRTTKTTNSKTRAGSGNGKTVVRDHRDGADDTVYAGHDHSSDDDYDGGYYAADGYWYDDTYYDNGYYGDNGYYYANKVVVTSTEYIYPDSAPPVNECTSQYDETGYYVWVCGYYDWDDYYGWTWIRGYWAAAAAGYDWLPGYWDTRGSAYVRIPGSWVKPWKVADRVERRPRYRRANHGYRH